MPIGPGLLESILNLLVEVVTHGGVDEGQSLHVGIDDEGIAVFTAHLVKHLDEADFQWSHQVLLCLLQLLPAILLEGDVLVQQLLQLHLALLEDRLGELTLTFEELLVLAVELVFHAQCLVLELLTEIGKLLLYDGVVGH